MTDNGPGSRDPPSVVRPSSSAVVAAATLRRPAPAWPIAFAEFVDAVARQIRVWAAAEVGPGRLFPWLPVAFGSGIVLYFTADREPIWWAALGLAIGGMAAVFAAR